jgi:hypothetical protein
MVYLGESSLVWEDVAASPDACDCEYDKGNCDNKYDDDDE